MTDGSAPPATPARRRPRLRDDGGRVASVLFGIAAVGAVVVLGAVVFSGDGVLPRLTNPFQERTVDRSQPVLLQSIQDLSRYTAASGNFEVVIDIEEDRQFLPDLLFGERILFVAAGTVDAYVDFSTITEEALTVDEAARAVHVELPWPELGSPNLDHQRSYVFAVRRGIVNQLGDFFGGSDDDARQRVLVLAEQRIAQAAEESELRERAAANTRQMLEGMLRSLGYEEVTVTFVRE